jgi:ABC-2 type transport system ATP-binding protein
MSIAVHHLSKNYGSQKAVDAISFEAKPGEIVGFLGPNGAGKSTTMKMITGYIQPDSGIIKVCGADARVNQMLIKSKIGYLPELNPLYTDMYVREYLEFIAGLHQVSDKKQRIQEVIEATGLQREAHKQIHQLSKGYKQRVGLAAAIMHNPEVLILDEPTSGLDPNQIIEIRNLIKLLSKDKTIIFSSHILQEVEAICDRVIIINKGVIVANALLEELKSFSEKSVVRVVLKEVLEAAWFERLPAAGHVSKISSSEWEIETENEQLLRQQLLSLAVAQNLNIVSLQTGNKSLEEVFRSATLENKE